MMNNIKTKTLLALCIASIVSACATSPTGRQQVLLFPDSQLSEMGVQAFTGMKNEQKVSTKTVENNYVKCIATHIAKQVPSSVFSGEWEIVVFDDNQVNAFALPGGKIGVYTGLLKVAENQDQLAAVIGHEVGHVIAQHGNERVSSSTLIGLGTQVVNQVLVANEVAGNQTIMAALGMGVQVGVQLPFSRTHESEADLIGLDLMAKAGFNPRSSVDLWVNMEKASGGQQQPEFMSTHPAPQTRIKQLQENMAPAVESYNKAVNKPKCS